MCRTFYELRSASARHAGRTITESDIGACLAGLPATTIRSTDESSPRRRDFGKPYRAWPMGIVKFAFGLASRLI